MIDDGHRLARYAINGVVATAIHYLVLVTCLEVLHLPLAGVANLLASIVGITVSFLGNRYFVFRNTEVAFLAQAISFLALFAIIALIHGAILFVWTDIYKFNYNVGFLIAVATQFALGYVGCKKLVFSTEAT